GPLYRDKGNKWVRGGKPRRCRGTPLAYITFPAQPPSSRCQPDPGRCYPAPLRRLRWWRSAPEESVPLSDQEVVMAHTLPPLPYPNNALEPSIDALTMEIHHDRHHKAYVDNLNKALESQPAALQNKPVVQLLREINSVPANIKQAVINNGGGH